jgi:hypothetical protein
MALYADFAEYFPEAEKHQMWVSSTLGCNTIHW